MPKITLINNESGKLEDFEPVDAREILAAKETIYSVPEGSAQMVGVPIGSDEAQGINVPQLHGLDAEMQTGLSQMKYARHAVVKAVPGFAGQPMTTEGVPISEALADKQVSGMTVHEMRDALSQKGVQIPEGAKKADLKALMDSAG